MGRKRSKISASTSPSFPTNVIGNIGLFHVCYELSRRGLNVVPTSRNTKAVDVIVGNADFSRHATIQVKTSTTELGTRVGPKGISQEDAAQHVKLSDFWVFVGLDKKNSYAVQGIHVCKGGDKTLLAQSRPGDYWWYEPCYPTKDDEVKRKWEKQKDDGGWQLITDSLSGKTK